MFQKWERIAPTVTRFISSLRATIGLPPPRFAVTWPRHPYTLSLCLEISTNNIGPWCKIKTITEYNVFLLASKQFISLTKKGAGDEQK